MATPTTDTVYAAFRKVFPHTVYNNPGHHAEFHIFEVGFVAGVAHVKTNNPPATENPQPHAARACALYEKWVVENSGRCAPLPPWPSLHKQAQQSWIDEAIRLAELEDISAIEAEIRPLIHRSSEWPGWPGSTPLVKAIKRAIDKRARPAPTGDQ